MPPDIAIRDSRRADEEGIERCYEAAFPEEELWSLVRALLREPAVEPSLVALDDGVVCGHVAFTSCTLVPETDDRISLLGPLAVSPDRQKAGIGSALVREGLRRLAGRGVVEVLVLGDPGYYGRFGFRPCERIAPAFPIPDEWRAAWQSLALNEVEHPPCGTLVVPGLWRRQELWAP